MPSNHNKEWLHLVDTLRNSTKDLKTEVLIVGTFLRFPFGAEIRHFAAAHFKLDGDRSAADFAIVREGLPPAHGKIYRDRNLGGAVGARKRIGIFNRHS